MGTNSFYIPATAFSQAFYVLNPAYGINPAVVGNVGLNAQDQVTKGALPSVAELTAAVQSFQSIAGGEGGIPSAYATYYAAIQAGNTSIPDNSTRNVDGILMTTNATGQVVSVKEVGTSGSPNYVTGTSAGADAFTLNTASASAGMQRAPSTTLTMNSSPVAAAFPFTVTTSPLEPAPESNPFSTPDKSAFQTSTPSEPSPSAVIAEAPAPPVPKPAESIIAVPEEVASQPAVEAQVVSEAKPSEMTDSSGQAELMQKAEADQPQRIAMARASSMPAAPSSPMSPAYIANMPQPHNGSAQLNLSAQSGGHAFSNSGNSQMGFAQGGRQSFGHRPKQH